MERTKILIVEDDPNLGKILNEYLEAKNYNIRLAIDGEDGLQKFLEDPNWDIILLDVMMPKKDGFSLAKDIRKVNQDIPIIFLTAKSQKDNVIKAFNLGADDYLTKPFSIEELVARIKAVMKRVPKKEVIKLPEKFKISDYEFIHNQNILMYNQKEEYKLTTKENELLKLFCENLNNKVDRNSALIKIWGDDSYYNARSMDVYIAKLRKYLKSDPKIEIKTIHGHGFKLLILE